MAHDVVLEIVFSSSLVGRDLHHEVTKVACAEPHFLDSLRFVSQVCATRPHSFL